MSEFLQQLIKQGGLAITAAIAVWWAVKTSMYCRRLIEKNMSIQDCRIKDGKEMISDYHKALDKMDTMVETIKEIVK